MNLWYTFSWLVYTSFCKSYLVKFVVFLVLPYLWCFHRGSILKLHKLGWWLNCVNRDNRMREECGYWVVWFAFTMFVGVLFCISVLGREKEGVGGWVCMWLFAINYFLIYTKKQSIFCYSLQLYKKLKHLFFENAWLSAILIVFTSLMQQDPSISAIFWLGNALLRLEQATASPWKMNAVAVAIVVVAVVL